MSELVGQLEALIGEHPYRERLRAQLMLALYRCERQADALQAYQDARRTLVDELGIEPGERLRELERAILAQDPALATPAVKTAEVPASRLPVPPTRTLGRDAGPGGRLAAAAPSEVRLVTLIGPGGVGKTRLALEVARGLEPEFRDGGWFVSLAATANAEHVPSAIAQALGVTPLRGRDARAGRRALPRPEGRAAGARQLRASPAGGASDRRSARLPPGAGRAGDQPRGRCDSRPSTATPSPHSQVPADADPAAVAQAAAGALFVERARSHDRRLRADRQATPARSPRSAAASTGCRSRSSSPRRAPRCSAPTS